MGYSELVYRLYGGQTLIRIVFILCVWFVMACATPHNGGIVAGSYAPENQYALSRGDLLIAGLLVDSVSWGERGRLYDAETQLRKAYRLDSDSPAIRFNLAVVLAQQGQREEAKSLLTALMESHGQRPDYLVVLADIQRQEGDYRLAGAALKAAFSQYVIAGNNRQAALLARSISNLAFLSGEEQEALCYSYESLKQITDGNSVAHHALLLLGLNQVAEAQEFLLSKINESSGVKNSGFSRFALSLTKVALGDIEGGKVDIKLAKQLSIGSFEYKDQLEALRFLLLEESISELKESSERSDEEDARLRDSVEKFSEERWYALLVWPDNVRDRLLQALSDSSEQRDGSPPEKSR